MSYASEVAADSPLLHWRLNTLAGTETDQGSGAHTATYTDVSMTRQSPGLLSGDSDSCVFMDCANGARITTPHAADLSFIAAPFTIELLIMWTALPTGGTSHTIVAKGAFGSGGWSLRNRIGSMSLAFWGVGEMNSTLTPVTNQRYHIVCVHRASGNTDFYMNNVKENLTTAGSPLANTQELSIGHWSGTGDNNGVAYFDEVAIYNTALSDARVLAHFNAAQGSPGVRQLATPLRW